VRSGRPQPGGVRGQANNLRDRLARMAQLPAGRFGTTRTYVVGVDTLGGNRGGRFEGGPGALVCQLGRSWGAGRSTLRRYITRAMS
jgi:hypothetical protein